MISIKLDDLLQHIGDAYPTDAEHYPRTAGMSRDQNLAFAVNHSVLHMSKSLGRIAAEVERFDHSGRLDTVSVGENVTKMLINVIKLADELGMRADEIAHNIEDELKKN